MQKYSHFISVCGSENILFNIGAAKHVSTFAVLQMKNVSVLCVYEELQTAIHPRILFSPQEDQSMLICT